MEGERGRETSMREREALVGYLLYTPRLGSKPATQLCVQLESNPPPFFQSTRRRSNQLSHISQGHLFHLFDSFCHQTVSSLSQNIWKCSSVFCLAQCFSDFNIHANHLGFYLNVEVNAESSGGLGGAEIFYFLGTVG